MGAKIKLRMGDWVYNAGLVGLYNILKHAGDSIDVKGQQLELDVDYLKSFEDKYFDYMINKYEKSLSWYKIVSYEEIIRQHEGNNLESFTEKDLEELNKYIKDVVKYYLNSASYKAAYELISNKLDVLKLSKDIETIKLKKNEKMEERLEDIREIFEKLKVIIQYCKEIDSKKFLAGKNVIYTLVKNAWDGVCFLNPQTKEKNMYIDYKEYFIDPLKSYIDEDASKNKYSCFTCSNQMKDLKNTLSFLNNIGFDANKKSSHVWNFNNDVAICPVCRLVYSCIPAGFTYVYNRGIYINENTQLKSAININHRVKTEILKDHEINKNLTYRGLVQAIHEQANDKLKYELADIQVVRFEDGNYRFNILSRQMISIIASSKDNLNSLISGSFNEIKTYFNLYELVIDRILNNQNLFTLVHKVLVLKLSSPNDCKFRLDQIIRMLYINLRIMEGMGYMEKSDKDIIKQANASGYYLREDYKDKGAKDKLNGIAYRLLNALKTSNKNMFMDTLLNCYLYVQKTVPNIFLEALKDEEKYKTIGYAFVTGLIEGREAASGENKKNGGNE